MLNWEKKFRKECKILHKTNWRKKRSYRINLSNRLSTIKDLK